MSSTSTANPRPANPSTPPYANDYTFVDAYLSIHKLSTSSYRCAYALWILFAAFFTLLLILHWSNLSARAIGERWMGWSLWRHTWRRSTQSARKSGQPFSFPSNGQILTMSFLTIAVLVACFAGPDYIAPSGRAWQQTSALNKRQGPGNTPFYNFSPAYQINKAWWTVGGRTGTISFSLFPLVILFALKAPPFALLALPFTLRLHFDKLARLHRWSGFLLWIICTIHVITWGVQLGKDRRGGRTNQVLWVYIWQYTKFIHGVVGYLCLSALALTSIHPMRKHFYESFYILHIILVPLTLVFSALHFPPIWHWCWVALSLWLAERAWRFGRVIWINGYRSVLVARRKAVRPPPIGTVDRQDAESSARPAHLENYNVSPFRPVDSRPHSVSSIPDVPQTPTPAPAPASGNYVSFCPPPGYAKAELLPGRTVRLHVMTHRGMRWAPGQHVLLRVPAVSLITTHPFTVASACIPKSSAKEELNSQLVVLIIRAKSGFTRRLWNHVSRLLTKEESEKTKSKQPGDRLFCSPSTLIKVELDGPLGSASRVSWDQFATILIIVGGSGISYGLSILQHVCHQDPSVSTTRVHLVWLVREYAHLQWAALHIYDCLKLNSMLAVSIDIYVAHNPHKNDLLKHSTPMPQLPPIDDAPLRPPFPLFSQDQSKRSSLSSFASESEDEGFSPSILNALPTGGEADHEFHPIDLVDFDGDDDTFNPDEAKLSAHIRRDGHIRRRQASHKQEHSSGHVPAAPYSPQRTSWTGGIQPSSSSSSPNREAEENPMLSPGFRQSAIFGQGGIQLVPSSHASRGPLEMHAMGVIASFAKSGRAPLEAIVTQEAKKTDGRTAVACCGPASLNILVRKIVANEIRRKRDNKSQGPITLISEEYEY